MASKGGAQVVAHGTVAVGGPQPNLKGLPITKDLLIALQRAETDDEATSILNAAVVAARRMAFTLERERALRILGREPKELEVMLKGKTGVGKVAMAFNMDQEGMYLTRFSIPITAREGKSKLRGAMGSMVRIVKEETGDYTLLGFKDHVHIAPTYVDGEERKSFALSDRTLVFVIEFSINGGYVEIYMNHIKGEEAFRKAADLVDRIGAACEAKFAKPKRNKS